MDFNDTPEEAAFRKEAATWLAANAPAGAKIGYDPWLFPEEGLARYRLLPADWAGLPSAGR